MEILRTPEERLAGLPGYPFEPRYTNVGKLRIHYVDEGPPGAAAVLMLHGEPSWSYLYRTMIPALVDAGHRALAPDLVGFGRSDKPTRREDYKAGARQFPALVPIHPDDPASEPNRRAWESLRRFEKPFLTAFSDKDPVLGHMAETLSAPIPGAQGQPHTTIEGGGHFLQDDCGPELARVVTDFIARTQ